MKKIYAFLNNAIQQRMGGMLGNGYANGYVAVPPEHPFHGKHYDEVNETVNVHGGLTFAEKAGDCISCMADCGEAINFDSFDEIPKDYWVFGFDTMHWGDDETLDRNWCINETNNLLSQFEDIKDS